MNDRVEFECICGSKKYIADIDTDGTKIRYGGRVRTRPKMYYCADCSILFKNPTDFTNFARRKLRLR